MTAPGQKRTENSVELRIFARPARAAEPSYFFDDGLRFECQRCGACCTGAPGTIYLAGDEIAPIARHLGISEKALRKDWCYPFRDSVSLREKDDGRCCFYEGGCRIYPVRPRQCRTWPFWFDVMRSEKRWRKAARQCPGMGRGRRYGREEILERIEASRPDFRKER